MKSIEEEVNIYIKSGLSPNELFITELLLLAAAGDSAPFIKYISNISDGKELLRNTLVSLQTKKVIKMSYKIPGPGEALSFRSIPFNKNFLNTYKRESHLLGKEFFEAYPPFININGKMCSIRNITKAGLYSIEEFCIFYAKAIRSSTFKHSDIMSILEWAKEETLVSVSIVEFIASHKWEELEIIKNSGDINGYKNSDLL